MILREGFNRKCLEVPKWLRNKIIFMCFLFLDIRSSLSTTSSCTINKINYSGSVQLTWYLCIVCGVAIKMLLLHRLFTQRFTCSNYLTGHNTSVAVTCLWWVGESSSLWAMLSVRSLRAAGCLPWKMGVGELRCAVLWLLLKQPWLRW